MRRRTRRGTRRRNGATAVGGTRADVQAAMAVGRARFIETVRLTGPRRQGRARPPG
jgi:hypothetical protein